MASIQEHLDKIKNAIFGKDVRQAIHDSIKQCYDDAAVNHDNANMEVKLARGSHNTLNDRLVENEKKQENFNAQLDTIANEVYIEQFTGLNDSELFNKAIEFLKSTGGGTIRLKNKKYIINTIELDNNINLIGTGNTVLAPIYNLTNKPLIHIKGNNSVIQDLIINDEGFETKGIVVGDFGGYTGSGLLKNVTISNVEMNLNNSKNPGILIGFSENTIIENCKLTNKNSTNNDTYSFGICIHSTDADLSSYNIIKNNVIYGFFDGIKSYGTGNRKGLLIDGNVIIKSIRYAIDGYHAMKSRIINNRIENCEIGIYFDSGLKYDDNGLGSICSNNQLYSCSKFGIMCEEITNGQISNNTIQESGVGILLGAGCKYAIVSNNNIGYNRIGIECSNVYYPEPLQQYYNTNIKIVGNYIIGNSENGLHLKGIVGLWTINGNDILCNNTSDNNCYGILISPDTIGDTVRNPQSILIMNNNISNETADNSIQGYQRGVKIDTTNYNRCILQGNYFNNAVEELNLNYGRLDIISNLFISDNPSSINKTTVRATGNIGLFDNQIITKDKTGISLLPGFDYYDEIPEANESNRGKLISQLRNTDGSHGDKYMICVRKANNSYEWKSIINE